MKNSTKIAVTVAKNAVVNDVYYNAKVFFFRNAEGLFFRLSFEGVNGWRLQTSKDGKFDNLGAAQALARFMNEPVKDCAQKLCVDAGKDAVVITEKKGTYAVLSLGKEFSLKFCAKDGKVISEVTDVAYNEKDRLVMKGTLVENEAIYGGGERFDVANKRGTAFDLFTCDGWNNSATTYVVIPVFLTTRGGGMYINRNDSAWVDFGKEEADAWAYTLRYGDMDCYFYPTGSMADTLMGYTELTGHAHMPTPWMQGMHICRYRPDFTCFERDQTFATLDDIPARDTLFACVNGSYVPFNSLTREAQEQENILYCYVEGDKKYDRAYLKTDAGIYTIKGRKGNPGGRSCKTIMETFIREDMKPAAASMEPRSWANCFCDNDESRADKADLIKSVEWLHAHGMKAMVYIRVGGINTKNIGFKPEYMVHADVTYTEADGTVEFIENTTAIPWCFR